MMNNYLAAIKQFFTVFTLSLVVSSSLADDIILETQQTADELKIHWWMQGEKALSSTQVVLMANNKIIPHHQLVLAPDASLSACYLFLTDTSRSMKSYFKKQVIPLLTALVKQKQPQHHYAMGRFDAGLEMLSSFSNDADELHKAIKKIQAKGQRTELFRAGLKGLEQLDQCNGYRKILILLSDGDAEDLPGAYSLQNVTTEAKKKKIAIVTVSFKDSIQTQNLLKLSEETGGVHFPYQLDKVAAITASFVTLTDNGASVSLKLQDLPDDLQTLTLQITLSDNSEKSIALALPEISSIAPRIPQWQQQLQKRFPDIPLFVWKMVLLFVGIIILAVVIFNLKRRTESNNADKTNRIDIVDDNNTFEVDGDEIKRQPIAKIESNKDVFIMDQISISIGALPQNDFVINDPTVGRYQATIDYKDNKFYLTDRGAANISQVNDEDIQHCELDDGDQLKFGNWQGKFSFLQE